MAKHDQLLGLRPQLLAYARAICDPPAEADDLVQDAIERALRARSVPKPAGELRAWMFRVIRNLHLDRQRRAKVRAEYAAQYKRLFTDAPEAAPSDPLGNLLVRQAMETLTADHREVVVLVDVMGMRYAEAAEILGVPEGTVMSRVSRARRTLLERLDESNVAALPRQRRKP